MMLNRKYLLAPFLLLCMMACRQSYEPDVIKAGYNYLVVEGTINTAARSVTTIKLSRTRNIGDSTAFNPQLRAQVTIVGKSGNTYLLSDRGTGAYTSDTLSLDAADEYALHIVTEDKRDYQSAFVAAKKSPDIDSLIWYHNASGLTVSVSTHDAANSSRYYRWEYEETWKYVATLHTIYGVKNGLVYIRDATNQVDSCWQSDNSSGILLGTSANLSQDVIANDSVAGIPQNSEKATQRYSILVRQYVLTQQAYEYWQLIQKSTQQLGSLFDAQPSQLASNITCTTNPSEPVIGYVVAGTASEKRLFITNNEAQPWITRSPDERTCQTQKIVPLKNPNYIYFEYPDTSFSLYYLYGDTASFIAKKFCLDCELSGGGSTRRPAFW